MHFFYFFLILFFNNLIFLICFLFYFYPLVLCCFRNWALYFFNFFLYWVIYRSNEFNFFSWFQPPTLYMLELELCIFFFVFFYEFIIISGPGHNLFKLTRFFLLLFLIDFFSILSINIKLVKNNYVIFLKKNMGLSWSHNSCCGFDKLTQVDSVYFLSFFNWIIIFQFHPPTTQSSSFLFMVFSILSFNITLFENWDLGFFLISTFNIEYVGNKVS
jgi:hypothetical protein